MPWRRVCLLLGLAAGSLAGHGDNAATWVEQRFPNGRLHSSRRYVDGSKDGLQLGYWPNGELRFRYVAHNGLSSGRFESWHDNGQIGARQHFEAGRESGSQQTWDRNGTLLSNYVVKDGRRYGLLDAKPCFTIDEGGAP